VFSLVQKRIVFIKKLKQQGAVAPGRPPQSVSTVKQITVNPEFGTVAVCLELSDYQENDVVSRQDVFIVWPNGQLQDEEPLKFSIKVDPQPWSTQSACVILSRCPGQQMLLGRLVDGKIFCWHLNSTRSQLVNETELTKHGGLVAVSDNGCWIAIVTTDADQSRQVQVFSYEGPNGTRSKPEMIGKLDKVPQSMSVQQTPDNTSGGPSCVLAISEETTANGVPQPIEVFSVEADGTIKSMYRLKAPSVCYSLAFCHRTSTCLLSGHVDGLVVVYDLLNGTTSLCHDNPGTPFLSICTDRSLILSTAENYFRIFKSPVAEVST
jgi:hypothetical protein